MSHLIELGNSISGTHSSAAVMAAATAQLTHAHANAANSLHGLGATRLPFNTQGGQTMQRLKVEDALSYLDQVKYQFGSQPQVYNEFLDIMKEFKSQSIDTPGVIKRVSQLFRGHSDLIVGFNTFLPTDYKIEIDGTNISLFTPSSGRVPIKTEPDFQREESLRHSKDTESTVTATSSPGPEFNQAINYVNKIKNRFQSKPDMYQKFLEILQFYQKEKSSQCENDVYAKVSQLFKGHEDLLSEFAQFLPDVTKVISSEFTTKTQRKPHSEDFSTSPTRRVSALSLRRSAGSSVSVIPKKKIKIVPSIKDQSLADISTRGSYSEFAFFDQCRRAFQSKLVYENFLRCIFLFNNEIITRNDLINLVSNFFCKHPDLFRWFKDFVGCSDPTREDLLRREERPLQEYVEIDFQTCKRYGASYRALPKRYSQLKCSGRSALPKDVQETLNDTLVSFPSWSEDYTFVNSRKTPYEENIYRCEDERFELDVVLEINLATIRVLENIQKRLTRMSAEDCAKFRLDNNLGGSSDSVHKVAIRRIYGDKASDIVEGLKKNPVVAVPIVLRRLKDKQEEWREAQKAFNKLWREQSEKFYLKSLDHQGMNFKQTDIKAIRSKSLVNEIEAIYVERQAVTEENQAFPEPHLTLKYPDRLFLIDACDLIIYHVKRQSTVQKEDKRRIKRLLKHFIMDLFFANRRDLSDDETDVPSEDVSSLDLSPDIPKSFKFTNDVNSYRLFFCNKNWYVFFRLHQILCHRLSIAKDLANDALKHDRENPKSKTKSASIALQLKQLDNVPVEKYYENLKSLIGMVLDGNMDNSTFEDRCRERLGINSYVVFTLDKVIQNIVRQLQHLVSADSPSLLARKMFLEESEKGAAGGSYIGMDARQDAEEAYKRRADAAFNDENCFKILISEQGPTMTIDLIRNKDFGSDEPNEIERWCDYVENYISKTIVLTPELHARLCQKPVFLPRNIRKIKSSKRSRIYWRESQNSVDERDSEDEKLPNNSEELINRVIEMDDNAQAKFTPGVYKVAFVTNSECFLYRRGILAHARKMQEDVMVNKHFNWDKRYKEWISKFISTEMNEKTESWLTANNNVCTPQFIGRFKYNKYISSC